jgi:hypothetical protein
MDQEVIVLSDDEIVVIPVERDYPTRPTSFGSGCSSSSSSGIYASIVSSFISDHDTDIQDMFMQFDQLFFYSKLSAVEVKWSKRMTLYVRFTSVDHVVMFFF